MIILSVGCADEQLDVYDESGQRVELRSSGSGCQNLILNPDFETNSCGDDGLRAFEDCVDGWECYYGSGDLVGPNWDWSSASNEPFWQNITLDNNKAFLCCGGSPTHKEGIVQKVETDPSVSYCLSFDVSSTEWPGFSDNGNLEVNVQFASGIDLTCSSGGDMQPACNGNPNCFSIPVPNNYIYPNTLQMSVNLASGIDEDALYIWATSDHETTAPQEVTGIFLDNVSLTCRNELLEGITATSQLGNCSYNFAPDFSGLVDVVEYSWDFGDGNSSMEEAPFHSYSASGMYNVTLSIVDANGCCSTVERPVMCDQEVCDYHLCWVGDEEFDMQIFELIDGVTIIDQNGDLQEITLFNQPVQNEGNYGLFYYALRNLLVDQYGLDPSQIKSTTPTSPCNKGDYAAVGYFVCDSPIVIVSFDGFLDNAGNIPWSVPFYASNCN